MREMIYELCICKEKTIRTENAYSSFKALDRIKKMQKLFFLHAELRVEVLHFIRFFFIGLLKKCRKTKAVT